MELFVLCVVEKELLCRHRLKCGRKHNYYVGIVLSFVATASLRTHCPECGRQQLLYGGNIQGADKISNRMERALSEHLKTAT